MKHGGFSLVELMVVVFVLGILALIVITNVSGSQETTRYSRANAEFNTFVNALKLYATKYDDYPADVSRGLPVGINEFIAKTDISSDWPEGPWPDSVYDYDRWDNLDGVDTYQVSIRFCPAGGPLSACKFPKMDWAANFGVNSALYYCIKGNCRSHSAEPATYPGYCVNCPDNKAIGT